MIYSKSNLMCHEIEEEDEIIQVATLQISLLDRNITLHAVYRSPNSSQENNRKINEFVQRVGDNAIVIGDFNYPSINWELMTGQGTATDFLEAVKDSYLTQHVDFPTHDRGNILDLVLTNIPNQVRRVYDHGKLGNSDHVIICTEIEGALSTRNKKHEVWNFAKANFEEMNREMANFDWGHTLTNEIEVDWDTFKNMFLQLCEKHIPKKTIKEMKRPVWMKHETLKLVRQKRAAWRKYKERGDNDSFLKFKSLEKKVKKVVGKAKHNYEVLVAKNAKTNPKMFYSYLSKKKQDRVKVGPIKLESGEICYQEKDMAEALNNHYATVFTVEDEELPPNPGNYESEEMEEISFESLEVMEVLLQLKNSASPGPDGLSQRVLKELARSVCVPLSIIFTKSYQTGKVPDDWKVANVVPIYKKGSKMEAVNYRPVSLTSVVAKVMERMIKRRMMSHLQRNNLINPSQHGFMSKKSTTTNLVTYMDYVTKSLDEKEPVDVLYLDFSKAFDKVPHKRLLQKLKSYKFTSKLLVWIQAWLKYRKQRVVVGGVASEWKEVISSVVQGSVLGPILFVIFINDIDYCLQDFEGFISKFADDTKIAKVVNNAKTAEEMQKIISNHFPMHGMCRYFHISKC